VNAFTSESQEWQRFDRETTPAGGHIRHNYSAFVPSRSPDNPAPLVVAASLVAVEGGLLLMYALMELGSLTSGRLTMGLTTAAFFAAYGAGLVVCTWQLTRGQSWARSPIMLAQLIQLGVAWSFVGGRTTWVAVALAVVAVVVIAGILHPASLEALSDEPADAERGDRDSGDPA
jgi:hypothetical protein